MVPCTIGTNKDPKAITQVASWLLEVSQRKSVGKYRDVEPLVKSIASEIQSLANSLTWAFQHTPGTVGKPAGELAKHVENMIEVAEEIVKFLSEPIQKVSSGGIGKLEGVVSYTVIVLSTELATLRVAVRKAKTDLERFKERQGLE